MAYLDISYFFSIGHDIGTRRVRHFSQWLTQICEKIRTKRRENNLNAGVPSVDFFLVSEEASWTCYCFPQFLSIRTAEMSMGHSLVTSFCRLTSSNTFLSCILQYCSLKISTTQKKENCIGYYIIDVLIIVPQQFQTLLFILEIIVSSNCNFSPCLLDVLF